MYSGNPKGHAENSENSSKKHTADWSPNIFPAQHRFGIATGDLVDWTIGNRQDDMSTPLVGVSQTTPT